MSEEINKIINWIEMSYTRLNYKEELLLVNYIKQLQQEYRQLKDRNKLLEKHYKQGEKNLGAQIDITLKYEKVLDEIREYLNELIIYVDEDGEIYFKEEFRIEYNDLLEILDKVKQKD